MSSFCAAGLFCFLLLANVCFFFFKQKTAYDRRISDWSSDVCSSDLDVTVDVLKAGVFLVLVVPLGGYLLPPVFENLRGLGQQEVFVLAAATLALLTAYGATLFGLSPALGAFIAGVVLSESDIRHAVVSGIVRSEEHTSELQSLMRSSYAVFCLEKK